jgi:hypothetical protein
MENNQFLLEPYLEIIDEDNRSYITIRDENNVEGQWVHSHGFRRGFCLHFVFRNVLTNKFAFHVVDPDFNELDFDEILIPNMGIYSSYKEMIDGIETIHRSNLKSTKLE